MKIKNYFLGLLVIAFSCASLHAMEKQEHDNKNIKKAGKEKDTFPFDLYDNNNTINLPRILSFLDEDTESESSINKPNSFVFDQSEQATKIETIGSRQTTNSKTILIECLTLQTKLAIFILERSDEQSLPKAENYLFKANERNRIQAWAATLFKILKNLGPDETNTHKNIIFACQQIRIFFSPHTDLKPINFRDNIYTQNQLLPYLRDNNKNMHKKLENHKNSPLINRDEFSIMFNKFGIRERGGFKFLDDHLHKMTTYSYPYNIHHLIKKKYQLFDTISVIPKEKTTAS